MNLTVFDLDHTLLPIDSDFEWGRFLVRKNAVPQPDFERRNAEYFSQYEAGTLDPLSYLEFALGVLAGFPRKKLDAWHQQYMNEVIHPVILPPAKNLVKKHRDAGDLVLIITATNSYVTSPIAKALGVEHLIGAQPGEDAEGNITGKLIGSPTSGSGKVSHLDTWLSSRNQSLKDFDKSTFYSDSHNDIPLLSVVTHPVATNPNEKLAAHAAKMGWPVLKIF